MLFNTKKRSIPISDTKMDFVSFGRGEKTLIILPGLSLQKVSSAAMSLSFMYRIFVKEYKVYIFDKRDVIPDGFTVKDMADDTYFAMQQLGITKASVFGVSLGGMVAQQLTIDHPDMVEKLIPAVTASETNPAIENAVNTWISLAEKGETDILVKDMLMRLYSDKYIRRYKLLIPLMVKLSKKSDIPRFVNMAKACLSCKTNEELHKITCPTFVLGGLQDKITTAKGSTDIAEKLGCEIYMYDEFGHAAYEEAKDFNKRIYDFLKK